MKPVRIFLILLALLILLPWTIRAAGVLPAGPDEFEFLYDRLERIEAQTTDSIDYQLGPYSLSVAEPALGSFDWLADISPTELRLQGYFGEDFRSVKNSPAVGFESFRGAIAARPIDRLFIYGSFALDEQLADDPTYSGKKWRGLAGDVQNAFVHFTAGEFDLTVGRFASFWGPRNSLALASDVSMDGLGYSYRWGRLTLSYRLARLDGLNPEDHEVEQFENRFFAGHRLDIHLSNEVRIGFFETAIFGGPGRQVELYYLNPILFYHATQLNDGINDNTLLGLDFDVQPIHGVKVWGQLLVDDYQIDSESQGDEEPNEIGLLGGFYAADVLDKTDIRFEYSRVTNWTFNQVHPRNRYTFKNSVIGRARGNDYELFELKLMNWLRPDIRVGAELSFYRQGEGRVDAEWTAPWHDIDGDYYEPFPTGTVQTTTTIAANVTGFGLGHLFVDCTAGVDLVKNYGHTDGDDRTLPFARLNLSTFFSTPLSVK